MADGKEARTPGNPGKSPPAGELPVLALDIGGSKFICGLIDSAGNILYSDRRVWNGVSEDDILRQIIASLHDIENQLPGPFSSAAAGGVTIPGFADPVSGVWVESDFLKVKNLPICDILQREFGIPFFSDNDCNACALAEQYFSGARDCGSFVYLTVSTGIGGALVLDSELYYGAFGHAGEAGLCVMEKTGFASDSGTPGVLEAQASGRGLEENYLAADGRSGIGGERPDGRRLAELAGRGDPAALAAMDLEGRYLGRAIADICSLLDPGKVVLGGGISLLFPHYEASLKREFSRCCRFPVAEIEPTKLGYMGAFLGAGAVALRGARGLLPVHRGGMACDTIFISMGENGLRCGLNLNGAPYYGTHGRAGSIGEYRLADGIREEGATLQSLFSPVRLLRTVPQLRDFADTEIMTALTNLAQSGDRAARQALAELGSALGRAAAFACVVLDPREVILQGSIGRAMPFLWPDMKRALDDETYYHGHLPFRVYPEHTPALGTDFVKHI